MSAYPPEVIQALFDAVEMDDVVDPVVSLPDAIPVICSQEDMRRCLALCVQFWHEGAIRADLLAMTATLLATGDLSQQGRRRFKLIRARYKHLRFALVLYGATHRAPPLFRATVAVMGHLQDAFKNRHRSAVVGYGMALRLLLSWPIWKLVQREVDRVRLDDADGFVRFRAAELLRLKQGLRHDRVTAHTFHAMRKIVSRQVSFYDTMRSLEPDEHSYRMSRFLSAINGLMGSLHDDLVEGAVAGLHDYHCDTFALPQDIRCRLRTLTDAYPLPRIGSDGRGLPPLRRAHDAVF